MTWVGALLSVGTVLVPATRVPGIQPLGWIVPIIGLALAALCVGISVRMMRRVAERHRTWIRAEGEAYGYTWDSSGENSSQYWKLRWTGADGGTRECVNPYGTSWGTMRPFPIRRIALLIDPADPNRAQVADRPSRDGRLFAVILLVVAGLFGLISVSIFGVSL